MTARRGGKPSPTGVIRENDPKEERRLAEGREIRYRRTSGLETLGSDLECCSYATDRGGPLARGSRPKRHSTASSRLERSIVGELRLWFLDVDGRPVAAWYCLRIGNVEGSYQSGRDPAWSKHSVGLLVLARAMRAALAEGVSEYRLLRGGEPYEC